LLIQTNPFCGLLTILFQSRSCLFSKTHILFWRSLCWKRVHYD